MKKPAEVVRRNQVAWDVAAEKYADAFDRDVAFLRSGGVALHPIERDGLGSVAGAQAVHLQCSHGQATLSLLNLGAARVTGVDISAEMLGLARKKSRALGAPATWLHADVHDLPRSLSASADLIYSGSGALPWIHDLERWAEGIQRVLKPGGRLFVFEGHPLNWVWEPDASHHDLASDGSGYFDSQPRQNRDFPASAISRFTPPGHKPPAATERQWTLGEIVSVAASAGLELEFLREHHENYWPQFPAIPPEERLRLPHSFSFSARAAV